MELHNQYIYKGEGFIYRIQFKLILKIRKIFRTLQVLCAKLN